MVEKGRLLSIPDKLTVRDLADLLGVSPIEVMKLLISSGILANINQIINYDTAAIVARDLGFETRQDVTRQRDAERPSTVDMIKLRYPLPIAKLFEAMRLAGDPRLRVQELVVLFEGIVRYLSLVGLAGCIHHGLSDTKLENCYALLEKPSLGHWVRLLKTTAWVLRSRHAGLLGLELTEIHKDDPIYEATRVLASILGAPTQRKKVKLIHFLDSVVQFRNRMIGHGILRPAEAKRVVRVLEEGLIHWLDALEVLSKRQLVHIATVTVQDADHVYTGTNLNRGAYHDRLELHGDTAIPNDRVYLHGPAIGEFLPLQPFFVYDEDARLLYVHDGVSPQEELILRCPYEAQSKQNELRVETDLSAILRIGEGDEQQAAGKAAAGAFDLEGADVESDRVDVGPTTEMARAPSRRRPLTDGAFFRILDQTVGEEGVRLTRRLISDLEAMGAETHWKEASFSAKLPDPGGSGRRLTLLLVNKHGETYVGWLPGQLEELGLSENIGRQYYQRTAALFKNCTVKKMPAGGLAWTRRIPLSEFAKRYDDFMDILSETIQQIRGASAAQS